MGRISLVFVLAACSHAAAPANTTPPPGGGSAGGGAPAASQCPAIADHLVGLMSGSSVIPAEQLEPFKKVIVTRCTDDLWTAQAQQCFADAKSLDDADKCQPTLTPAQQESLQRDGMAAAQAAQGNKADAGAAAPAAAPPADTAAPSPAPSKDKRSTRGPAKTGGDPCEGGE